MTDGDSDDADASNFVAPDAAYILHYQQHITASRAHLAGSNCYLHKLSTSYHAPHAVWSKDEKHTFFSALARHSRLRPDLIAADIGPTKTTLDVCVYLDALHAASESRERTHGKSDRHFIPIATEASPALVAYEEDQAARLATLEPAATRRAVERMHEEEARTYRIALRRRGGNKVSGRDREREREKRKEYEKWRGDQEALWRRDALIDELDRVGLGVLDSMLREEDTIAMSMEDENETDEGVLPQAFAALPSASTGDADEDDEWMIDPVLRQPSRSRSQTDTPVSTRVPISPHTPLPLSSHASSGVHTAASPMPSTPPPEFDDPGTADIHNLSPASRRRLRKRLYMRRKRAQASGGAVSLHVGRLKPGRKRKEEDGTVLPSPVSLAVEVGTKATEAANSRKGKGIKVRGLTPQEKFKRAMDASGVNASYLSRPDIGLGLFHLSALGGLARLYATLDVDARREEQDDADDMEVDTVPERLLAGPVISQLHTLVRNFVRDVAVRAIVHREKEHSLKTKVWRLGERQVVNANVEHALEEMGVDPHMQSRREYLAQLVRRFGGESELDGSEGESEGEEEGRTRKRKRRPSQSADNDGSGESDTGDEDEEKQDGSARTFAPVSIHRQMYAPFIHTHSLLGHGSAGQGDDVEESDDSIDEEALLREMEEEKVLDKYDIAKERRAEAWIWRMLKANRGVNTKGSENSGSASESTGSTSDSTGSTGSSKEEGTDEEESDEEGDQAEERKRRKRRKVDDDMEDALIYRAPDGNKIKSAVFVDESDESDDDDDDDDE